MKILVLAAMMSSFCQENVQEELYTSCLEEIQTCYHNMYEQTNDWEYTVKWCHENYYE